MRGLLHRFERSVGTVQVSVAFSGRDICKAIAGSKYFSIPDLSDAYLQMEVEEESQTLLTITTHKGLFKCKRLPPGVKSAQGAFQKVIDSMIGDLEGVESFLYDVLVHEKTPEKHDLILQRIQEYGFRLKLDKCRIYMTEVKYIGHIMDQNGIRTDPEKVSAIVKMPSPRNVTELRSFLGAVYYYAKFINELHQLRWPFDKKAIALIYAVTKFHRMILGRPFVLETDHQPLLRIFGSHKGIPGRTGCSGGH